MVSLIDSLRGLGVEASQRYHISNRAYRSSKGTLSRIWLRCRMYLVYPLVLAWRMLTDRRPAVLVITTNTFYAPAVALLFRSRRNHRVVHLIYDLFPDALVHSGMVKEGAANWRVLNVLKGYMLRRSDANVMLGAHLREHILSVTPDTHRPHVIAVGAEAVSGAEPKPVGEGLVQVLYCGNMGFMHDTDTVTNALAGAKGLAGRLVLRFHASGGRYSKLKRALVTAEEAGVVQLGEPLASSEWRATMLSADVALVTMVPGSEAVVMPSKTYSALAAGQAILCVAPGKSDLARLVREHECGWVIEPGDVAGLQAILEQLAQGHPNLPRYKANALRAFNEHYSTDVLAVQWSELFGSLN